MASLEEEVQKLKEERKGLALGVAAGDMGNSA